MIHPDALITPREAANDFDDYASMTKEQLIEELMKARIRETRLKKRLHGERSWCSEGVCSYRQREYHEKYLSHGYRWLNANYKYKKAGTPCKVYPNLLLSELNVTGPMQCVVSDMTAFYVKGIYYELTIYMDLWNNEILSHSLSSKRGDRMTYISGLESLIELKKQYPEFSTILHSDQGSVYTSKAFNELLPAYNIIRSMSRAGTPTDNGAMEAINGWIKAELFTDLHTL